MKSCVEHGLVFAPGCMACEATRAEPEYDWKEVAVALSASNARLCEIVLKADVLAKAVEDYAPEVVPPHTRAVRALAFAVDEYKITRNGH